MIVLTLCVREGGSENRGCGANGREPIAKFIVNIKVGITLEVDSDSRCFVGRRNEWTHLKLRLANRRVYISLYLRDW